MSVTISVDCLQSGVDELMLTIFNTVHNHNSINTNEPTPKPAERIITQYQRVVESVGNLIAADKTQNEQEERMKVLSSEIDLYESRIQTLVVQLNQLDEGVHSSLTKVSGHQLIV